MEITAPYNKTIQWEEWQISPVSDIIEDSSNLMSIPSLHLWWYVIFIEEFGENLASVIEGEKGGPHRSPESKVLGPHYEK